MGFNIYRNLFMLLVFCNQAQAKDVVDNLIKKHKVTETEYITHYNETQAITSAKNLIKKHRGSKLEPELRHRLADLYVRKSKTRNFLDQVLKKKGKDFKGEFESIPKKQKSLKSAIYELQNVEKRFPRYRKMDEVYYTMGMSYLKLGQVDLAERPFLNLIRRHKQSSLVQDSNLSLAEIYYHQKNYKSSGFYFSKIIEDKSHNAQSYSMYKRAWTEYYRQQYKSAFQDMKSAYLNSKSRKDGFDVSSEVVADLPLFTAEVFKGSQVYGQLSSFLKDSSVLTDSLDAHARVFADRSDYRDEIAVLSVLLKGSRDAKHKFEYLSRLSIAYEKIDNLDASADYYRLADRLLDQKVDEAVKDEFLVFGRNLVKNTYKLWVKSDVKAKNRIKLVPILKIGDMAYKTISNSDKQKPKFINILAELNFDIKNFDRASHFFEMASDVSKDSKESHELLYSAIVSHEKSVNKDKWTGKKVLRQRHLVLKYDQKFSKGKYLLEVLYKFARVEEKYGKQSLALSTFKRLGGEYPDTVKGQDSQNFVIKIYEKTKNYSAVNSYLSEIIPRTKNSNRLIVLKPIFDNSFFLMAQQNEDKKRFKDAIINYRGYLKSSYLKTKTTEAMWNIAINYKKAGLKKNAANAYLAFYKSNKNSKNSKVALEESLALYEKIRKYSKVEEVAWILESITSGDEQIKWAFSLARVNILNKKFKDAEIRFSKLVNVSNKKININVHQHLFDHVDKIKVGFKANALRVLQNGQEPFRSEAMLKVAMDALADKKVSLAKSKFRDILQSRGALAESKAKASIFLAEMKVQDLSLDRASKPMNFDRTLSFIERTMAKAQPITLDFQDVLKFGHDESSLRALIKLSRLYLDLGMIMASLVVVDKADLKLAIEREIRNLKTTLRTSFYQSYENSLNIMAKNRKLKSKYNYRVKKIKREFEKFYNQKNVASR